MCFNCILEDWCYTNELEKSIKLFPKKNRVRIVNYGGNSLINRVMGKFLYCHLLNRHNDLTKDDICYTHDTPDFVYYDFKSRELYKEFLKILHDSDYAYLYGEYKYKK